MSEQDNQEYLQTRVNPILHQMCVALLQSKPEGVVQFIIFKSNQIGRLYAKMVREGRTQIDFFPQRQFPLDNIESGMPKFQQDDDDVRTSSDEDEEGDEVFELPSKADLIKQKQGKVSRQSVSAEAYGKFNKKEDWVPVKIEKTQEQQNRILDKLNKSFMFQTLTAEEKQVVVDAMEEKQFGEGTVVINQGENGDHLYVVDEGQVKCERVMKKGEEPTFLKNYQPGEAFGELALLYNAPRAATLTTLGNCKFFVLDRSTFNHVVKDATMKKRKRYETFLSKVELLDTMEPYERSKIADVIKTRDYKKGEYIIREGEKGNTFYFIEKGEAVASKMIKGKQEIVFTYKENQYFGELALLKNIPRQANIIAKTDISVVFLERSAFMRLLGPLEDILKRNANRYAQFCIN